jgi:hypothetical protein
MISLPIFGGRSRTCCTDMASVVHEPERAAAHHQSRQSAERGHHPHRVAVTYCSLLPLLCHQTGFVHGYSKGPRWMSGDLQCRPKTRLWRVPGLGPILMLPGCAFNLSPFSSSPPPAAPVIAIPPSLRPDDIVGRWGLAAYHRDQDRARTEVAAKDQCTQPYLIDRSPGGNISMLGHDNPQPQEMILKGSVEGKTYVGPGPSPAAADDREVVSFEGQVLQCWY